MDVQAILSSTDPVVLGLATLSTLLVLVFVFLLKDAAVLRERLAARGDETAALREQLQVEQQRYHRSVEAAATYREQISKLDTTLAQERTQNRERLALLSDARQQMTAEFKSIAADILEDKSERFTLSNKENISEILKPLNEKIQHFEKKVADSYEREARERFSLAREIQNLQELNARISEDAVNLTNALKGDNRAQGGWGEVILESILEKSGLVKGREYEIQVSLKGVDGSRSRPDVIVRLPEKKEVVIDAKVSLLAYENYCSEPDEDRRSELLKKHVQSIHNHIKLLSAKDYQNLQGLNSLDFILMFMPVEAAFTSAVQHDAELFSLAFDKNIIVVGPSTLLATLRTIQNLWRYEQQSRNAQEIASSAGALYDKFVAFVADLEEVGERLGATRKSFDRAHNKLSSGRGNLLVRAEKLKALGARTSKSHGGSISEQLLNSDRNEDLDKKAEQSLESDHAD